MDDVIRFPIPDGEATPDGDLVWNMTPTKCGGKLHFFQVVPGACECGQEFWGPNGLEQPQDETAFGIHYVA